MFWMDEQELARYRRRPREPWRDNGVWPELSSRLPATGFASQRQSVFHIVPREFNRRCAWLGLWA